MCKSPATRSQRGRSTQAAIVAAAVTIAPASAAHAVPCHGGQTPVCTFQNDFFGFLQTVDATGGSIRTIDFETLPDGSPSHPGPIYLTPTFNYTSQGVTFSAPVGQPYIGGNPQSGYDLAVLSPDPLIRDWIIADLARPTNAVGVFFPGRTTLYAYDTAGGLIGSVGFASSGTGLFVGIISDAPISRTINNEGIDSEDIESYIFNPVPEPATATLLLIGTSCAVRTRRRARRRS